MNYQFTKYYSMRMGVIKVMKKIHNSIGENEYVNKQFKKM